MPQNQKNESAPSSLQSWSSEQRSSRMPGRRPPCSSLKQGSKEWQSCVSAPTSLNLARPFRQHEASRAASLTRIHAQNDPLLNSTPLLVRRHHQSYRPQLNHFLQEVFADSPGGLIWDDTSFFPWVLTKHRALLPHPIAHRVIYSSP